jgi:SpoVK/Ycf46/Vps4 family AAA+-type ATPase
VHGNEYTLETALNPQMECDELPFEELVKRLKDEYEVPVSSKVQVVITSEKERTYVFERRERLDLALRTTNTINRQKFRTVVLPEYAKILQACVETHFASASKECPDVLYVFEPKRRIEYKPISKDETALNEIERKIRVKDPEVEFDDIGGCEQAKREMLRICADIEDPDKARFFGRDPHQKRGYLLLGEPGTGKTLLGKALATKLVQNLGDKIKVYFVHYQDITSIFRGGEAIATGKIFEMVQRNEEQGLSTLLFLDEIHLIGSRRADPTGAKDEALDTLLAHLDGLKNYRGLTVIGATYMPVEKLDPALTRDGRLSRWITIEPPTLEERKDIFMIYIDKRKAIAQEAGNEFLFAPDLDQDRIAKATEGFNGAHIAGVIERVVDWKYDQTPNLKRFKPITTKNILRVIKNYNKVKRKSGQSA